jgi:hypothetical protein
MHRCIDCPCWFHGCDWFRNWYTSRCYNHIPILWDLREGKGDRARFLCLFDQ